MTDVNNNNIPDEVEKNPLVKFVAIFAAVAAIGGIGVVTSQIDKFQDWYCRDTTAAKVGEAIVERTVRLNACEQARICLESGAIIKGIDFSYCVDAYERALNPGGK